MRLPRGPILIFLALFLGGCDKGSSRYEFVQHGKSVIRLDRQTGEMISINEYEGTSLLETASLAKSTEVDPSLLPVRVIKPEIPGLAVKTTAAVTFRWRKGELEFQTRITPFNGAAFDAFASGKATIRFRFLDGDGFAVAEAMLLSSNCFRMGGDAGPTGWGVGDATVDLGKDDFKRIVTVDVIASFPSVASSGGQVAPPPSS